LIALSERDAALYAANSFQVDHNDKLYLFMPDGVSDELLNEVRRRSVEPVLTDVSEFLAKGGGSIKCMILDLGPSSEQPPEAVRFRSEHSYQKAYEAAL
jgi:N,N dimethylarginine dimethylhydrolase-like protein